MSWVTRAVLYCNGKFLTLSPSKPTAESVASYGGRIIWVGDRKECIDAFPPGVTFDEVDLQGRVALPGFRDSHLHLLSFGLGLANLSLHGVKSIEDLKARVTEASLGVAPGEWIIGRGWDQDLFREGRYPSRFDLDEAAPGRPVYLIRACGHVGVASSKALEIAGITENTPDPPDGAIDRDESGQPTGILREAAQSLLLRHIPKPGPETLKGALKAGMRRALKAGLTSVNTNDGQAGFQGTLDLYKDVMQSSGIRLRIYWDVPWDFFPELLETPLRTNCGNEFFKVGAIKLFADGSLGARTAALEFSYEDDPGNAGMLTASQEELSEQVYRAHAAGMQVAIHAIGDRALRIALSAIASAQARIPWPWRRHRIVHAQVVSPELVREMRRNRVVADIQPRFIDTDMRWAESRLGKARMRYAYAWKTLLRAGIPLAGGSDCPVEPIDPLLGIYAAVTRKNEAGEPEDGWYPEEKLTVEEAIKLFTSGAAFSAFQEDLAGVIEPGKFCDLTVLNQDPLAVAEDDIKDIEVVMTVVGGEVAYSKD